MIKDDYFRCFSIRLIHFCVKTLSDLSRRKILGKEVVASFICFDLIRTKCCKIKYVDIVVNFGVFQTNSAFIIWLCMIYINIGLSTVSATGAAET